MGAIVFVVILSIFSGGKKFWQHIAQAWKVMVKMNPFLLLLASRNILQLICDGLLSTKVFTCHYNG